MGVGRLVTQATGVPSSPGYAHAVTASGRLAFLSGQIPVDQDGRVVGPDDLAAQTRQALRNMHAILRELDADWDDVVKFTWYMLDASEVQTVRDVRDEIIRPVLDGRANPASTLIQVAALVQPEFLIEVDAVVALP